jgi:hypothetical protein
MDIGKEGQPIEVPAPVEPEQAPIEPAPVPSEPEKVPA